MSLVLEADSVAFAYDRAPVLRGVGLTLAQGQVVALLGPTGSGKSTLLRCLLGQLRGQGAVRWKDKPLEEWTTRQLARTVAYLAQSPAWEAQQRVSDVLRLGRAPYLRAFGIESEHDIRMVREVAAATALGDMLDRRMDQLSGGQRQRVFVARCLVQEPAAMLLDEPSTYLDLRLAVEMGQLLRDLARRRGIAVLLASHDVNLAAAFADRLVLLEEGKVVAEGAPEEVLEPTLISRVYGIPMQRGTRPDGKAYVFPVIPAAS